MSKEVYEIECLICHKSYLIAADPYDLADWRNGKYIQDAMPYLSAAERELFISKTCEPCFDDLFPEEEDDDFIEPEVTLSGSRKCLVCDNTDVPSDGFCIVCGYFNN
jgi:hypothetical protein